MKEYKIAVIPGDGVGTEVTKEAIRIADCAAKRSGNKLTLDWFDIAHGKLFDVAKSIGNLKAYPLDADCAVASRLGTRFLDAKGPP